MGELDLKVPRVRVGNSFRPSLLPEKWERVDKDYENLLLALLANGYSRARIKATLEKLNLPYSSDHQLCLVHLKRNLRREFGGMEYREMRKILKKIMDSQTREEAEGHWERLIEAVRRIKPRRARELEVRRENYLAFTSYP